MPTINYTHTIVDGSSVSSEEVASSIYNHDNTTGDSLAVYNGGIGVNNLSSSFEVSRDMIQRNSYTGDAKMAAGNANLDYFAVDWFANISVSPGDDFHWDKMFVSVPGLSTTWENKRDVQKLLFFWNFTAIAGNNATAGTLGHGSDGTPHTNRGFRFVLNINGGIIDELDFRGPESSASMVPQDYTTGTAISDPYNNHHSQTPDLHHYSGWIVVDGEFLASVGTNDSETFHSAKGSTAQVAPWLNPLKAGTTPRTQGWHSAGIQVALLGWDASAGTHYDRLRIMSRRFGVVPFYW